MASPVGHALAGYAIARIGWPRDTQADALPWLACAALAVAPDLDLAPGILVGRPALYHQGASHSLAAALAVSFAAALVLSRDRGALLRAWLLLFCAYTSHLLLDLFGPDARAPIGMPLFWPLSDATYLSPITLLPGIQHAHSTQATTSEWIASLLDGYHDKAVAIELAVVGPLLLLAGLRARRRRGPAAPLETRSP